MLFGSEQVGEVTRDIAHGPVESEAIGMKGVWILFSVEGDIFGGL